MSNERYWIFHEWVRSNYTLESGYTKGTWDTLALAYWFYEDDEYYLQFENKTKSDNEIDLHIGESVYDMPLVAWLLKNAPYITTEKMIGRVAIEKYGPNRNSPPCFNARPIAIEIFNDIRPNATDNQTQNGHTSSIQSDTEELQSKGYKYLSRVNKASVFLF